MKVSVKKIITVLLSVMVVIIGTQISAVGKELEKKQEGDYKSTKFTLSLG